MFDQKLGAERLVITEADNFAFRVLHVIHGHSEVAGAHGDLGAGPVHEVVVLLRCEL